MWSFSQKTRLCRSYREWVIRFSELRTNMFLQPPFPFFGGRSLMSVMERLICYHYTGPLWLMILPTSINRTRKPSSVEWVWGLRVKNENFVGAGKLKSALHSLVLLFLTDFFSSTCTCRQGSKKSRSEKFRFYWYLI